MLVYLCGFTGIVLSITDILGFSVGMCFMILAPTLLLNTVFWFLYTRHNKLFIYATAGLTVISVIALIPYIVELSTQIRMLSEWGVPISNLELNPVFLFILLVLVTFFLFALEFAIRSHTVMLSGGIALILLVPIFGHTMTVLNMILLLAFEIGFIVINMSEKRSSKRVMKVNNRSRINLVSMLVMLAVAGTSLIPAFLVERSAEGALFEVAYQTDSFIKEKIAELSGNLFSNSFNDGSINRGNLYQNGSQQLSVSTSSIPSDRLYIKGFVGKDYSDSNWSSAFSLTESRSGRYLEMKEPFIDSIFEDIENEYAGSLPYSYYYLTFNTSDPISEMYYMLAPDSDLNSYYFETVTINGRQYLQVAADQEENGFVSNYKASKIFIRPTSRSTSDNHFIPYYAKDSEARLIPGYGGQYSNYYLTASEISLASAWSDNKLFEDLTDEYIQAIGSEYTNYPRGTVSRLEQIVRDTPLEELNEITTYILVTLQNHAVYTTTPGTTPYNKDVIDYFLFDNGQGYCVHFASAAALMYRMYGIPARYVTGFVINPTEFHKDERYDGYYSADVTDKSAHAWVEIFLKDYGWVPVEVTPTQSGSMSASYPGYNPAVMNNIMNKKGWSFRSSSDSDDTGGGGNAGIAASSEFFTWTFIAAAGAFVIAAALILFVRRRRTFKNLGTMSCRRLFDRIMRMLHYSGLMTDSNGTEKNFAEKLCQAVPDLPRDKAERLYDIMCEVNYSEHKTNKENRDLVEECCRDISFSLYSRTPFYKKPLFRFLHNFI